MNNEEWLMVFRNLGGQMREGIHDFLAREGGQTPLGRGAGGDRTFPIDKWAEDIIITALEKAHRQGEAFTLISEETGIRKFGEGKKTLLVDPVDGSNNAKSGIPFFSTSIALLEGNMLKDLSVGYVMNLAEGGEFWAIKGGGAYRDGKRIHASDAEEISIVAYEASHPDTDIPRILPLLKAAKRTRCFGSTALDLSHLASGALGLLAIVTPARAFDYAAGMLILKEAGGVITDFNGASLDNIAAGLDRTAPILAAANKSLHKKALDLLTMK